LIFTTFAIYLSAGRVVLQWRSQLLKYTENLENDMRISSPSEPLSPGIIKRTEIFVSREPAQALNTPRQLSFENNQGHLSPRSNHYSTPQDRTARQSLASVDANSAAISYCKCALLFFVALLVTWVPSTINRVVTLVHPQDAIFGLNYASGLVLPLQGFWNAIIYIFTSLPACRALIRRTTTVLHIDQMSLRWTRLSSTTAHASDSFGRGSKKQSACCSDSVQELRTNSVEGLRISVLN
jgi:hypothetical protein